MAAKQPEEVPGANINFGDLFRYADIVAKVVVILNTTRSMGVGTEVEPGVVKFKVDGKRFEWDLGTLTRVA